MVRRNSEEILVDRREFSILRFAEKKVFFCFIKNRP